MIYKINTEFEIWDFNDPGQELPTALKQQFEELDIFQFIYFFTHIYEFDGYVSYPTGTQETMGGEEVFVFTIYEDTDALSDWLGGNGEQPDCIEVAMSQK